MSEGVVIVGSGAVAANLAAGFVGAGVPLRQIFARNRGRAEVLARAVGCASGSLPEELCAAELYIIAVSDSAVKEVSSGIDFRNAVVAHTSGALPLEELDARIVHRGIFYPLQTFTRGRTVSLEQVPFFVAGSDDEALHALQNLAGKVSVRVLETSHEQLRRVHLAAVFACNFVNRLYAVSADLLSRDGLPFTWLEPLVRETLEKAVASGEPARVQTGPASRADYNTLARHRNQLALEGCYAEIYEILTESILKNK